MSTAPSAPSAPVLPASGTTAPNGDVTKKEQSNQGAQDVKMTTETSVIQPFNAESEFQLVSSLAKLQELERKVSFSLPCQAFIP